MISEELYAIVPDDKETVTERNIESVKAAVLVHLYYEEQVDFYYSYLEKIPCFVDVVIISSKESILEYFVSDRFLKVKKENRGRDISALLVAAKDVVFQYEYICFIHDKKEKMPSTKAYVDLWRKNLWDNMLKSGIYIYNILEMFENDNKIGLLVPLPPHKRDAGRWLYASWGPNYENTKKLADELNIKVDISPELPPYTYSTAFWARTKVLEKLYLKDWKYTDFPNEPMQNDGEINHAIERIMQYLAEDAGCQVKIVLSSSFARHFISLLQGEMIEVWDKLKENFGIMTYQGLNNYHSRVKQVETFCRQCSEVYLYGAGKVGRECLRICQSLDIRPKGIIVTKIENAVDKKIEGVPLVPVCDIEPERNTGIIVSVDDRWRAEIVAELEKRKFYQYLLIE